MEKIMIGIKATKDFKNFLKKQAKAENRTLSNFIFNAVLTYLKDHRDVDWHEIQNSEDE